LYASSADGVPPSGECCGAFWEGGKDYEEIGPFLVAGAFLTHCLQKQCLFTKERLIGIYRIASEKLSEGC
jgi:hypothetical protein